ncbi:MAG: PKD domain-containing protein [Bacteroidales bacterium]|nr:PKD domain-containing protein [Bacteroidales bacterium]
MLINWQASHAQSAPFSASPTTGCESVRVSFTTTVAVATSWQWDFGDGVKSTAQNPSHQYDSVGSYTVTFIANNADTFVLPNYIRVYKRPKSSILVEDTLGLGSYNKTFTALHHSPERNATLPLCMEI